MKEAVLIIGAGPAGLTAARCLHEAGVEQVEVLERNLDAGGLPQFCGHPGWGMMDLHRFMRGPSYARELVRRAAGVTISTGVTVTRLLPGGFVEVLDSGGLGTRSASAVLLTTGIRETPRPARLVSGTRPWGVTTTGAFQDMVYIGGMRPFKRPVIVGTEWVSFSALLTARHGGIRPVAMIEEASRITARRPADILARGLFGVPVLTRTRLTEILGTKRVEGVEIERDGKTAILDCDGVIFTGLFSPEATLVRTSHLALDEGTFGPAIDNHWRCSDPAYFAAGNVLRAVEHSGMAAAEGAAAARSVLRALRGDLPRPDEAVRVRTRGALAYAYPQRLCLGKEPIVLRARARVRLKGELRLTADDILLSRRRLEALPERRLTVKVDPTKLGGRNDLTLALE